MAYSVKEIFYSLQGEGANSGRPAVFCRFAGCNLWSGREEDRAEATCQFCDTDFVGTDGLGGGEFNSAGELLAAIRRHDHSAPSDVSHRHLVVFTGGEPLLQLDAPLIALLHDANYEVAIETNGTLPPPAGVDWICVSPKAGAELKLLCGHELKLVFPQEGLDPQTLGHLDFQHFFLQPMDGPRLAENTQAAIEYCLRQPRWRLSLQTHKILGLR
jgi:7-carboxy-7-deazaguanine synthase (Cx14CxxC type)